MADGQETSTVESGGTTVDNSSNLDLSDLNDSIAGVSGQLEQLNEHVQTLQDSVNTLLVGISSIDMFILLSLLLIVGIIAALIFVVALRKL